MANSLFVRQNDSFVLKSLVSQRRLYSSAKRWGYAPNGIVAILFVVASFWQEDCGITASWIVATFSFVGWGIALFGEKHIYVLRHKAARIQQFIDCKIFREAFTDEELATWSDIALPGELCEEIAKVSEEDIAKEGVRNWYSDYSALSPQHAVFCCQSENVRWDFNLRMVMIAIVLLCFLGCVGFGLKKVWDLKVCQVLPILIAGSGVASALVKVLIGLVCDCIRISKIKVIAAMIERNLNNGFVVGSLLVEMQKSIYENRCSVVFVPDFIYKLLRHRQQKSEEAIAEAHTELERVGGATC